MISGPSNDNQRQELQKAFSFPYVITIDGPAGSGKSRLGIELANHYNAFYLDSGKIYRALALAAFRNGTDYEDAAAVFKLAKGLNIEFRPGENPGSPTVMLNGEAVTNLLRGEENSKGASIVSKHPIIREHLIDLQRVLGKDGCVTVGRDMGTVIFPEADLKIYLDADVAVRALRRYLEDLDLSFIPSMTNGMLEKGSLEAKLAEVRQDPYYQEILAGIESRDDRDSSRPIAPLKVPDGAFVLDNTLLDGEGTLSKAVERMDEIMNDLSGESFQTERP